MYVVGLILFLLLFLALYLTLTREQQKYEEIESVMDSEKEVESEERNLVWEGKVKGYNVLIKRGVMFRDSNRLITIELDLPCTFYLRLEPANPLRRLVRKSSEFFGPGQKIKQPGPLENFLIYSDQPNDISRILTELNRTQQVEVLEMFHHVVFSRENITAWFYQTDIDIEEIKSRTEKFVELLGGIKIKEFTESTEEEIGQKKRKG